MNGIECCGSMNGARFYPESFTVTAVLKDPCFIEAWFQINLKI